MAQRINMDVDWFKGKKILIMGLGLHGGGLAVSRWMLRAGARVTITDLRSAQVLQPSIDALSSETNRPIFVLGEHRAEDFRSADLIIQNPGVPHSSPYLAIARDADVPIENEATLFFALARAVRIGVTGTRGKSTTASLIGAMLQKSDPRTIVAGVATHMGVTAFFDVVDGVREADMRGNPIVAVLELSSWQLDLFFGKEIPAPHISVITNVFPDHLNRYDSFDSYARAKKNIFLRQTSDDTLVLNYDNPVTRSFEKDAQANIMWFSRKSEVPMGAFLRGSELMLRDVQGENAVCSLEEMALRGDHNIENALAAIAAASQAGASVRAMASVLKSFAGVPGRMERIGTVLDRSWINDTAATTPEATIAAVETLSKEGTSIILIAGGSDKDLDFSQLAQHIANHVRLAILLPGAATEKIHSALPEKKFTNIMRVDTLELAVDAAWRESVKGDTILLSPAATSFGAFANSIDRGRQFTKMVQKIIESNK